jgi:uncharacterized membrane protein
VVRGLRPGARAVAAAFLVSGTAHVFLPRLFRPLMPPALPAHDAWIVGTGAAEVVSAIGLLRGTSWAPATAVTTLLVVWPGNWWYAIDVQRSSRAPTWLKVAAWARVPLQAPMITAAAHPYVVASTTAAGTGPAAPA